jgi:glycosyltransferase involved in cell wall biosynthesis
VYEYTKALSQAGHDVHAIVAQRPEEPVNDTINGVVVHRISVPRIKKGSLWPIFFFLKASRKLKEIENKTGSFDIVHVYMALGSFFIPLIGNKKSTYILSIVSGSIRSGLWNRIAGILIRGESKSFDTITVLDKGLAKTLFRTQCVHIVPLGADFKKFKPQSSTARTQVGIPHDHTVFVYTGSVHQKRNIDKVLSAFKKVVLQCESVTLLIIGGGKNLEPLKKIAKTMELAENVIFTGYVGYDMVPDLLNAADIALSYVPMTPGFDNQPPLKTVEYMACGLPTIATNTAGNRVFIQDTYNGILTQDDEYSLSNAMLMLIKDRALKDTLKKNSRPSVKQYDWSKIVNTKLIPFYESCVDSGQ